MQKWAMRQYVRHLRHNKVYAQPGVHRFAVVLDNLKQSFNIGKIFRSGDAFGAHEIHLVNIEHFATKAAKGSFKWVPAYFHQNFSHCYADLVGRGYNFFVLDPKAPQSLLRADLPEKSAFVFGHEEHGFSFDLASYQDITALSVPQFGRVDSLNVSIAASVVMYEYVRQHGMR